MTVQDLIKKERFHVINIGEDIEQEITVPFCCDLLSIAMGKAPTRSAWITIMGNINTLAVASLAEISCIVLAEGVLLDDNALVKAREQKITVLSTDEPIFNAALAIHEYIRD